MLEGQRKTEDCRARRAVTKREAEYESVSAFEHDLSRPSMREIFPKALAFDVSVPKLPNVAPPDCYIDPIHVEGVRMSRRSCHRQMHLVASPGPLLRVCGDGPRPGASLIHTTIGGDVQGQFQSRGSWRCRIQEERIGKGFQECMTFRVWY